MVPAWYCGTDGKAWIESGPHYYKGSSRPENVSEIFTYLFDTQTANGLNTEAVRTPQSSGERWANNSEKRAVISALSSCSGNSALGPLQLEEKWGNGVE